MQSEILKLKEEKKDMELTKQLNDSLGKEVISLTLKTVQKKKFQFLFY